MKTKNFAVQALPALLSITLPLLASADETNWAGPYFGLNAGYGWGKSDVSTTTVFSPTGYFNSTSVPAINKLSDGTIKPKGWLGGLTAGYGFQSGAVVSGVELDLDALSMDESRRYTATYPCCAPSTFTNTQKVKADWLLSARGRVGYAVNQSLFYATGGLGATQLKSQNHFTDNFGPGANESSSESKTKYGWVLGLGYEHAMQNNWSIKAEYLHADFGHVSSTSNNLRWFGVSWPTNTFSNSANLGIDLFRIGINKKW